MGFSLSPNRSSLPSTGIGPALTASYDPATRTLSGSAAAGSSVLVRLAGAVVATVQANSQGVWSYTFPTAPSGGAEISVSLLLPDITVPAPTITFVAMPIGLSIIVIQIASGFSLSTPATALTLDGQPLLLDSAPLLLS